MDENPYKAPVESEPVAPKRPSDSVPRKSLRIITVCTFAGGTVGLYASAYFGERSDWLILAGALLGGFAGFVMAWLLCDDWRPA